ncbi:response regulator transcription factor [Bacillus sp. Xin]|uniref:response regulator transcription factor n=1 Tax=unclassified Bacillus (in: firmicutes) TaxID=185979 RepID=UPI0015727DA1|nr:MULTISPECIES: response regulator transcription factor [unclassified Bacillus (in: firmicutes)]MBC6971265.1 response regulator transcription factor [Bacillus sp. Xin]NSW35754.1 response regulator transcription factor [Bacillus sp. Xin1]
MIPMNILLIDDHALFAKSLEMALEDYPDINQFRSLQNVENVITIINEFKPDITLLDINLSNISSEDGLGVAKIILDSKCNTKIVILTGYDLPVYQYEAQKLGVSGFINKNVLPEALLQILNKINKGACYFPISTENIEELTNSEKQILQLLCDGYKRKEIASMLYASDRTISNHIQRIFNKLDVSSALEAVTKGIKLGYIQPNY